MAPSIIWIDEIDALFAHRSNNDHSVDVYNKALFLSLWDGLSNDISESKRTNTAGGTHKSAQVVIFGATNRPQEVDEAFLRRMSRQYEFSMPDGKTRELILTLLFKTERVHDDVKLNQIASKTDAYSGSDLKELCKYAATLPLREFVRTKSNKGFISLDGLEVTVTPGFGNGDHTTTNGLQKPVISSGFFATLFGNPKELEIPTDTQSHYYPTPGTNDDDILTGNVSNRRNVFRNLFDDVRSERSNNSVSRCTLRAIEMNDLEIALTHIKSTLKAHHSHQQRYGARQNANSKGIHSLFNMFNSRPFGVSVPKKKKEKQANHNGNGVGNGVDNQDDNADDSDTGSSMLELE